MDRTRELLSLPPWEALVTMINAEYGFSLDYQTTYLYALEPLEDNQMELTIQVRRSKAWHNLLPQVDQYTFQYRRLDLGTFFNHDGHALILDDSRQFTTTIDLMREIEARTGVCFAQDDIYHEPLPNGHVVEYVIRAHPRSLRWVGELRLTLGIPYQLTTSVSSMPSPESVIDRPPHLVMTQNQTYFPVHDRLYVHNPADQQWTTFKRVDLGDNRWIDTYDTDVVLENTEGVFHQISTCSAESWSFTFTQTRHGGVNGTISGWLYQYGGMDDLTVTSQAFERYNLNSGILETLNVPSVDQWPVTGLVGGVHDGELVVMGHDHETSSEVHQVFLYNPAMSSWRQLGPLTLPPLTTPHVVSHHGTLTVVYTTDVDGELHYRVGMYNETTGQWDHSNHVVGSLTEEGISQVKSVDNDLMVVLNRQGIDGTLYFDTLVIT